MNRRGFISMLAGAAGASVIPWRAHTERLIILPSRQRIITALGGEPPWTYTWTWVSCGEGGGIVISREAAATFPGEGMAEVVITDSVGNVSRASAYLSVLRDGPSLSRELWHP